MNETHDQLKRVSEQESSLLRSNGFADAHIRLAAALECLTKPDFTILIVGEYNRGKSMLLNALAGREIFATSALPVPTINILRYADQASAICVIKNVREPVAFDTLPLDRSGDVFEVNLPIEMCRDRLVLVEFPTLSETLNETDVNRGLLRKAVDEADLILMVLASDSLYSNTERSSVENELKQAGHRQILFVCNSFDRLSPSNQKDIRQNAIQRLPVAAESIFFTSALQTVESGADTEDMTRLRTTLTGFNAVARNRIREHRIRTLLDTNLATLREHANSLSKRQTNQQDEMRQQVQQFMTLLNAVKTSARQVTDELEVFRHQTRQVIESKAASFVLELSTKIELWLQSKSGGTIDISALSHEELRQWQLETSAYLRSRLADEQTTLQVSLGALHLHLQKLVERLPSFSYSPLLQVDVPSKATINIDFELTQPSISQQPQAISLTDLPEVLVVAVGTVIVSFFWNPFVVIPAGLAVGGILVYSRITGQQQQQGKQDIQAYTIQVRKQSDEIVLQAAHEAETYFVQIQKSVSTQIAEIVNKAEAAIRVYLSAQSSENEPTNELANEILALEKAIKECGVTSVD